MKRSRPVKPELPSTDAALAGLLFALDPYGFGGVRLCGMPGVLRRRWLEQVQRLLPQATPWLKVPVNVSEERLLGGLDFAATIGSGKPVIATGLLEAADGGVLVLSMAERVAESAAAVIGSVLDCGDVRIERDGLARQRSSRFGVIALDESIEDDECVPDGLADRLAFSVPVESVELAELRFDHWSAVALDKARQRLHKIRIKPHMIEELCRTAVVFGIPSLRAEIFALRAARGIAALRGGRVVSESDAAAAARLVLAHRARTIPVPPDAEPDAEDEQAPSDRNGDEQATDTPKHSNDDLPDEVLVDAVVAAIPPDLLAMLNRQSGPRRRRSAGGRGDAKSRSKRRGRPIGVRPTDALGGQRINVLATLKSAAPWQKLRGRAESGDRRLELRKEDIQVTRFKERIETTIVFVVDASGSQAAQRLAEVKGAIELLLNDCYVRRDQVALVTFRGTDADILLPPTRSLARARRLLAALPGGGGTPLAAGIDTARELADGIVRQGRIPAIVLMTDGRANITRERKPGAEQAEEEALAAGRLLAMSNVDAMLVDTARRPRPRAQKLADAMHARYVPLPRADAETLSATVQRGIAA